MGTTPTRCSVLANDRTHVAMVSGQEIRAQLPLEAGDNVVLVSCSDAKGRRIRSASTVLHAKLDDAPTARARVQVREGLLVLDASESTPREGSLATLTEFAWSRVDRTLVAANETSVGVGSVLELPLPDAVGEHEYAVRVRDDRGREAVARVAIRGTPDGRLEPLERAGAQWLEGAVIYGVVPPLFGKPPLASVVNALDGLRELGVRALWLSPLFAAPPQDFGYAVTNYFRVRDELGGSEALRTLVREAHARGLRILLDLVINHSSNQHPYFIEAAQDPRRSHYFAFYQRDARGAAEHYFDWAHLPNLNYANREVRDWVLALSRHWVANLDVDGYRVDAAWGVRQRDPTFFPIWSGELRRLKPDVMLLAEASARDPYYLEHGFDAAYDWSGELGHHAWEHVFSDADRRLPHARGGRRQRAVRVHAQGEGRARDRRAELRSDADRRRALATERQRASEERPLARRADGRRASAARRSSQAAARAVGGSHPRVRRRERERDFDHARTLSGAAAPTAGAERGRSRCSQ
jgi:hypothetical protein